MRTSEMPVYKSIAKAMPERKKEILKALIEARKELKEYFRPEHPRLAGVMTWSNSPQGHSFWEEINDIAFNGEFF